MTAVSSPSLKPDYADPRHPVLGASTHQTVLVNSDRRSNGDLGGEGQHVCLVGSLPWHIDIVATEMTIRCRLLVDRALQRHRFDNCRGAQVKMRLDEIENHFVRYPPRAEGF